MRVGFKFIVVFIAILTIITTSGVFAIWRYAREDIDDLTDQIQLSVDNFHYTPEDVLPDDNQNELKENHYELVMNILNESKNGYGLNVTKKTVIHDVLDDDGIIFGNQNVEGGNLKHIFIDKTNSAGVMFVIVKISDTEYHNYTFSLNDLNTANLGDYIEVYKTNLIKNDDNLWTAPVSFRGRAKVYNPVTVERSVNHDTWEKV